MRTMSRKEQMAFLACVGASLALHFLLVLVFLPGGGAEVEQETPALAARFARVVNSATDLDGADRNRLDGILARIGPTGWRQGEMAATVQWVASDLGLPLRDSDVVRALDPERSREGRWDIRVWLRWEEGAGAADLLRAAYLVGEATLKSDFGSHRLWIHLEAEEGTGRVAFETVDCRLYRAGKLGAVDLLHRGTWADG